MTNQLSSENWANKRLERIQYQEKRDQEHVIEVYNDLRKSVSESLTGGYRTANISTITERHLSRAICRYFMKEIHKDPEFQEFIFSIDEFLTVKIYPKGKTVLQKIHSIIQRAIFA